MMEPVVIGHEGLENIEKMDCIIELEERLKNIKEPLTSEDNVVMKRSIYKLPEHVTNRHSEAYEPLVVSIGPYHYGSKKSKAMEGLKDIALHRVLRRSGTPLKTYLDDLKTIVEELRDAYDNLADKWKQDTSEFLRMMLLDGCFILEILRGNLRKLYEYDNMSEVLDNDRRVGYSLIFTGPGKVHLETLVRRDMLLIENQVPLLLLEKILLIEGSPFQHEDLLKLILKFCSPDTPFIKDGKCLHILDVCRKSLVSKLVHTAKTQSPRSGPYFYKYPLMLPYITAFKFKFLGYLNKRNEEKDHDEENGHTEEKDHIRHSVTEIKEVGIKFKCIGKGNQRMSFEWTTLWLPKLFLDDASKSTFLNILAFETSYENAGNELTAYIFFMNKLIKSVSDVRLLKEEGIIDNSMERDEDVVQLFYQLSNEIMGSPLNEWYVDISSKINNCYASHMSTLGKWKYILMNAYFKTPWTTISVLAATSIFCFTATQTVYAILSYGPPYPLPPYPRPHLSF